MILLETPPVALTIAGSDPSGGAGIQADLKAFHHHDIHGSAVITALTVQSTSRVHQVQPIEPELVARQLETVLDTLPVGAIKLGMLATGAIAKSIADILDRYTEPLVVIDPVIQSTSGHQLLDDEGVEILRTRLLPRATLVTPNTPELTLLAASKSPEAWLSNRPCSVLHTGGHSESDWLHDVLYGPSGTRKWTHRRNPTGPFHGTGCALSSAITAQLAGGAPLEEAIDAGIRWLQKRMSNAWRPEGATQSLLG